MTDPARCVPVPALLDLAATLAFRGARLGFAGRVRDDDAIRRRHATEIHVGLARDSIHPKPTACRVRGARRARASRRSPGGLESTT